MLFYFGKDKDLFDKLCKKVIKKGYFVRNNLFFININCKMIRFFTCSTCFAESKTGNELFLLLTTDYIPDAGCESSTNKWTDDEDPELLECLTLLEEGRAKRTCWID